MKRVLVIGGYGNFGGIIAHALAADAAVRVLIGGRSAASARAFAATLRAVHPPEAHALDIADDPDTALARIAPDIVVHTSGPFQGQDHRVARACIALGCHYVDLADARAFVTGIAALDTEARAAGVLAVSGASSVPCLGAAVLDDALPGFARLERLDYGIATAQRTARGLATTRAVLGYVGRPFTALRGGALRRVFGWQDLRAVRYPGLGVRLLGNCDVPDLDLFPARYPTLREQRFAAGHELAVVHLGTWAMSWLVRLGVVRALADRAGTLLRIASWFDRFGSDCSGFHVVLSGIGHDGAARRTRFFLIARSGDGATIPCVPAILLARRLARGEVAERGAMPCLGLVTLADYLGALGGLDITVMRD